mgnify:CR=1 FL=1
MLAVQVVAQNILHTVHDYRQSVHVTRHGAHRFEVFLRHGRMSRCLFTRVTLESFGQLHLTKQAVTIQ